VAFFIERNTMLSAQSTAPLIERVPVTKIKPAAYNPRKDLGPHDPEYQRIVRSISEFGLVEPLVWNRRTGNLVGGHQRFKVLVARGVKRVNVSVVDLPLAKEKALNLALNRVSGEWDDAKLAEILDELVSVPEFEIDVTGFDLPDVQEILASAVGPDSDGEEDGFDLQEDLETHGEPITRQGDLIRLGPHRVLCGDATDPAQVRRLLRGKPIDLLFTDPPYNVSYTGDPPQPEQAPEDGRSASGQASATADPSRQHERGGLRGVAGQGARCGSGATQPGRLLLHLERIPELPPHGEPPAGR
jgi:hypothetical protein